MAKHSGGRPSKYDPKYCKELIRFFDQKPYREVEEVHTNTRGERWSRLVDKPNDPPFLSAFARKIKVHIDTLYEWEKKYREFSEAITCARKLQEEFLVTNGLKGITNPAITSLMLKTNHGYNSPPVVDQSVENRFTSLLQELRRVRDQEGAKLPGESRFRSS